MMTTTIKISGETHQRLKEFSGPHGLTFDNIIQGLLDEHDKAKKGVRK